MLTEIKISVFTESQAEAIEAMLKDSGFRDVSSEDWTVADEFVPHNHVSADFESEGDVNWEEFRDKLNMLFPGFAFLIEKDEETTFFTSYPAWAEGRVLTREEFLSLFPEDYKRELLEREIENEQLVASYGGHY
jgi:hypothetical protein